MPDYSPLHEGDPFPHDRYGINGYGYSIALTGEKIAEQVILLRQCADEDNWETETADAFRDRAADTADAIEGSSQRYINVGHRLQSLADTLADVESRAADYAEQARHQESVIARNPELTAGAGPDGELVPLTGDEQAQNTRRTRAQTELERLRGRFEAAVQDAEECADAAAADIRGFIDDDLKDGWWDNNAGWLEGLGTALGVIAAIAGLVLLFCNPVGWVLAVALIAGALALAISSGLAMFSDGSWWKVGFDLVGLVTLGTGGAVLKGLRAGMPAMTASFASARGTAAFLSAMDTPVLSVGNLLSRTPFNFLGLASRGRELVDAVVGTAQVARASAVAGGLAAPTVPALTRFAAGGTEMAENLLRVRNAVAELPVLQSTLPAAYGDDLARLAGQTQAMSGLIRVGVASTVAAVANEVATTTYDVVTFDGTFEPGQVTGPVGIVVDLIGRFR